MLFSSLEFIFFFLPIVCIPYFIVKNTKIRNYILILASLFFYTFGEPKAVLLMLVSIVVNYGLALLIEKRKSAKKFFLTASILVNIGLLFWYKYTGFFVSSLNSLLGLSFEVPVIHLPIGISFFTFQAMSYVIDVYRGDTPVQKKLSNLMLYISFFPQLIAGPIIKYHDIDEQIENRQISLDSYVAGSKRFLIGLFKKVLIANNAGALWEAVLNSDMSSLSVAGAWLGAIAFSLQIYFDFSGYSDMAIGLGRIFGFRFLENFNYPYISRSIREFWRRWHISLSTWFKEYLYIPLGGSRKGNVRTYFNLLAVFLCTGIWHGASWNFVIWGIWHGFFSVIERLGLEKILKKCRVINHIYTLCVVVIGFVIFAITDFTQLGEYMGVMLFNSNHILVNDSFIFNLKENITLIGAAALFSMPVYKRLEGSIESNGILKTAEGVLFILLFIVTIAYLVSSAYNPFLYFRF